jgi:pyruvyltransferase
MSSPILAAIRRNHPELLFIDIANYNNWTDFIDQMCECEAVFSSSLHGLIVAEAYGIPNYWISVSENVLGHGFKFRDYFASIGKSIREPLVLEETSDPVDLMAVHPWSQGRIDLKKLLQACPFKIKEHVHYEHTMDL